MNDWQPIETAPKDETPILGWCKHDIGPYFDSDTGNLTTYGAHCEGLSHVNDGPHVISWGGEYREHDYESGVSMYIPAWWFQYGSDFEVVANPIYWMSIPDDPT